MTQLPPQPQPYNTPGAGEPEASSLSTLSIFYFILAGLESLFVLLGLLYVVLGLLFGAVGAAGANNAGDAGVGIGFGAFFVCFGIFFIGLVGTFAYLNYLAGKSLRQRKRLTLCYVMAVIACLNFPLGTILGIFTFITLSKPGVKESFH